MNPLLLLLALVILEQLILWTGLWHWRKKLALVLSLGFTSLSIWLAWNLSFGGLLIIFINLYRIIAYGKLVEGRLHNSYLLFSSRRTSFWLLIYASLASLAYIHDLGWTEALYGLVFGQFVMGLILLFSTIRHLKHTSPVETAELTDHQLPTLTVAIPARNESIDLRECLESVLASRYPKLEVIVLDDSSARSKPNQIIKQFAHDGVRFIPSDETVSNWLPKNQAYQRLSELASGDIILFCGVDVRFQPDSLRQLVSQMKAKNKQMMCVLPENVVDGSMVYSLVQPIRYAWELALPRRLFRRPPVISSCWLINKQALKGLGGFNGVTRMIIPEQFFARQLIRNDGYRFMRSGRLAKVMSTKSKSDQTATAIRTRYPRLHKRVELVLMTVLLETSLITLTLPFLVFNIWSDQVIWLIFISALATVLQFATYGIIMAITYTGLALGSIISLPVAMLVDIWLLNKSMWKYEFSQVYWKGRDVTATVMHKTPFSQDQGKIQ